MEGLNEQLRKFRDENPFEEDLEKLTLDTEYLVEVFRYVEPTTEKSTIITYDALGRETTSKETHHTHLTNLCKILKVGVNIQNPLYKEGDIVFIPLNDVKGEEFTQEYLQALQHSRTQGIEPIIPKEMQVMMPAFYNRFKENMFSFPGDSLTTKGFVGSTLVLLYPSKIKGKWEF